MPEQRQTLKCNVNVDLYIFIFQTNKETTATAEWNQPGQRNKAKCLFFRFLIELKKIPLPGIAVDLVWGRGQRLRGGRGGAAHLLNTDPPISPTHPSPPMFGSGGGESVLNEMTSTGLHHKGEGSV